MRTSERGFSLIEVVMALLIMTMGLVAVAPMFVHAAKETAVGGDLGTVGVLAVERMEQLRSSIFPSLASGGALDSNVSGYSDLSNPDFDVRWTITDGTTPAGIKIITVRAIAHRDLIGQPKQVTLVSLRGE